MISILYPYILKAKKFAKPLFQSKKMRKKCVNPGVIFGPFGVIVSIALYYISLLIGFGKYSRVATPYMRL